MGRQRGAAAGRGNRRVAANHDPVDVSMALLVTGSGTMAARLAGAMGLAGSDLRMLTARSGIDAMVIAMGRAPVELLVIDRVLPGLNGVIVTRAIRTILPDVRVVMVVASADDESIVEALGVGADAVFAHEDAPEEISRIVQQVRSGEAPARRLFLERPGVAARVVELVQGQPGTDAADGPSLRDLTPRELAIVDGVVLGMSNREIGERLHLTEQTVKNYMTTVLRKLRLHDRLDVVRLATREGWASVTRGPFETAEKRATDPIV